uniref:F-box domain-containing protein n=1 Tax=Caenorhabditis tropicalis TaxID=1561998 RepID=A0A1I7UTA3_9PELO
MNLLRLPLVVLTQIFKMWNFRTKFFVSLLSKRARTTLKLACGIPHFSVLSEHNLHIRWGYYSRDYYENATATGSYCIGGNKMEIGHYAHGLIISNRSMWNQLLLVGHVLDTFPKATFTLAFYDPPRPELTLKLMKTLNQRKLQIKTLYYMITLNPSKFVPKILDECTKVTDYIRMRSLFPDDFVYNPIRPFKAATMEIYRINPWFELESFLYCGYVDVQLSDHSERTAWDWSSFFTNWMDYDTPLQRFELHDMKKSETQLVLDELRKQGISRIISDSLFEIKKENGSEFFIRYNSYYVGIYTKQAYLEYLEEIERRKRLRRVVDDTL